MLLLGLPYRERGDLSPKTIHKQNTAPKNRYIEVSQKVSFSNKG